MMEMNELREDSAGRELQGKDLTDFQSFRGISESRRMRLESLILLYKEFYIDIE